MSYPYPVDSSGIKLVSTQVSAMQSFLAGIDMISPTSGTATLIIYDSENNVLIGKKVLAEMEVDAGMPSCNHEYNSFVLANRGIYAELTDASVTARFVIRYALR